MNTTRKKTEALFDENEEFVPEAITGTIIVIRGTIPSYKCWTASQD